MSVHKPLRRLIVTVTAILVLPPTFLFVFIHIQQRVLRHRAEALLVDVRSLELRNSTWVNAEDLFRKWGAWGHYEGTCAPAHCSYDIELNDLLVSTFNKHPKVAERSEWLLNLYVILGGRPVQIRANVRVIDGKVWGKNFSAFISVPREKGPNTPFAGYGYTLIGSAKTVPRFIRGYVPQLVDHNEYVIGTPGGCTGCLKVYTEFTPYLAQHDSVRLMDFNLDCITRRHPCKEKAEIMPHVWKEYTDGSAKDSASWDDLRKCNYPIHLLARDTSNAVIAEVLSNRTEKGTDSYQVSRMRLVRALKGAEFWPIATEQDVRVFDGTVSRTAHNSPEDVVPGKQFILLFNHAEYDGPDGPEVWLDECGCIPATNTNLAEVQAGINRDFESKLKAVRNDP
jgi:hypothetical protein